MEKLSRITGVCEVQGRLWAYYFEPSTGANYTLVASGEPAGHRERSPSAAGSPGRCRPEQGDLIALGAPTGRT